MTLKAHRYGATNRGTLKAKSWGTKLKTCFKSIVWERKQWDVSKVHQTVRWVQKNLGVKMKRASKQTHEWFIRKAKENIWPWEEWNWSSQRKGMKWQFNKRT